MGGPAGPVASSLDRLKALDSLPDLDAQLEEAQQLCTHPARAEMALKWVLGKLKSSLEYATRPGCWDLLSVCVRLVHLQRAASLLSTGGFIDALQSTCAAPEVTIQLLSTITRVLKLILDLSDAPNGASIRTVLTLESSTAATISGNWLQHLNSNCSIVGAKVLVEESLLEAPLRIWSMRKGSSTDDELFSSHCLVPVSLLLTLLETDQVAPTKRKRGDDVVPSTLASKRSLESLIAKHVTLPARAVFFKATEPQSRKASRSETDKPAIKERLGPIKMAVRNNTSEAMVRAIPLILDIALRAVSMSTPRHRSHERPWIECIFDALQSCLQFQGSREKTEILAAMIDVLVRRKFTLSSRKMSELIKNHALELDGAQQSIDLKLTAALIRLDANAFHDQDIAQTVFNALPFAQPDNSTITADLIHFIVVSIMTSFAQGRRLPVFVDMWYEQLVKPNQLSNDSVWLQLSDSFAKHLEESLSPELIIGLFERFASGLKVEASDTDEATEELPKLRASLTILGALVRGVRNEEMPTKLQSRLDGLLDNLFETTEADGSHLASIAPRQLWSLLTRVFELWFPCWAAQQNDRKAIAERGVSLLTRKTFRTALSQSVDTEQSGVDSNLFAQEFVATVCECFVKYEESPQCVKLSTAALEQLGTQRAAATSTLLKHPDLLRKVSTVSRNELFSSLAKTTPERKQINDKDIDQALPALLTSPTRFLRADLYNFVLQQVQAQSAGKRPSDTELIMLQISRGLAAELGSEQRAVLLDAVVKLPKVQSNLAGSKQLQERLSLMVEIVTASPSDLHFADNADAVWTLAALFNENAKQKSTDSNDVLETSSNLHLLQELTRHVIGGWVAAQGKKKTIRDLLVGLSERIEGICAHRVTFVNRSASLVVLQTALTSLEACPENIKSELKHRDSKTLALLLKTLVEDGRTMFASLVDQQSSKAQALRTILEALLAVPDSLLALSSTCKELVEDGVARLTDQAQLMRKDPKVFALNVVLFQLECKYTSKSGPELTQQAETILQLDLEAQDYAAVLSAYEGVLTKSDRQWRFSAITALLQARVTTTQSLLLLQRVLKTLDKDDFDTHSELSGAAVYNHILKTASNAQDHHISHTAWQTLTIMIKERPFLVNQYSIEQTTLVMSQVLSRWNHAPSVYMDAASVLEAFFSHHRSRLQGRFHLLVALFQAFLTSLFHEATTSAESGVRQARTLARLLESFCSPPRIRHRTKASELVDEARKAEAHAGQFARHILHHYCAQVLTRPLEGAVREALMPGIWALIEAIEVNNSEGIKSLSAAVNNSERAVLRSVYDDWKRFGKWEGL